MKRTWWSLLAGVAVLACGLIAAGPAARGEEKKGEGSVVEIAGFKSKVPANWKEEEPSEAARRMGRLKQFKVPKVGDDKYDAEFLVFHFQGGGGGNKANIDRWKGMFAAPEGKTIDDVTKVETTKVGDTPVTYVDIQATYKFKKAPFDPNEKAELRPHYRMIAVIFESKDGPYFIRFVGPAKTLAENKKGFDEWLKGLK